MSDELEYEEPQKRSALGRVLKSIFLMGIIAIFIGAAGLLYAGGKVSESGPLAKDKVVTIKRGMGTVRIARMLSQEGVISNPSIFMIASYIKRAKNGGLKAGEFKIPAHASISKVITLLQTGKSFAYKVTIPEGWTTERALERIAANKILKGDITLKPGEGSLLPDTYAFHRGETRDSIVKRMQNAQKKLLDKLWAGRRKGLPIKSQADVVNLASIVERETGVNSERAQVAAIFVNRLNKKMRLQSDPTIIYGIVGGKGKLDRPITKKDIAAKTPYNTYQIDGLPPTPIANPGKAAIVAVLNPAVTKDLYFVADGTGGHAFATNLKDHLVNVAKWRKIEKQRKSGKKVDKTAASAKTDKVPKKAMLKKKAVKAGGAKTADGKSVPLPPVKPAQN